MVTVKTIRAGIEYRANVNGKSLRLVYDQDSAAVWINTNTAHLGGFLLARFGGALSPQSIREFFTSHDR